MKGVYFLVFAVLWLTAAVVLSRTVFGIHFSRGIISPATAAAIFRLVLPVLFFGWIVPATLGLWLLWAKK